MLRLFVTTDNHIGCHENSGVRYADASTTFDEAMSVAQAQDADLVLQCGDLFDKNKPSKLALYSTVKTLRRRCLGDRAVEFEVRNEAEFMLEDCMDMNHANFEDENINVGLPIFAINGNHDDSGGGGHGPPISPLDILGVAGLVNHFGRVHNNTQIDVTPVLLQKGDVKVALYGFGNVRDERLYQTFKDGGVRFRRPAQDPDSWYSILVLHQNHTYRGVKRLDPEDLVPDFVDLVIWGHEHECLIDPRWNRRGFFVMQPGSSVATSYHSSEAGAKHVAVVAVGPEKHMECTKFMLQTVRPFVFRSLTLAEDAAHIDPGHRDARRRIMEWLTVQVDDMIAEANQSWAATHPPDVPPMLPLIRLRVDYSFGYELENAVRFGNTFADRVANPEEILHAVRRRETEKRWLPQAATEALVDEDTADINIAQVTQLMKESLEQETLRVLPEKEMSTAIARFVEKDESRALEDEVGVLTRRYLGQLRLADREPSEPGTSGEPGTSAEPGTSGEPGEQAASNEPATNDPHAAPSMEIDESLPARPQARIRKPSAKAAAKPATNSAAKPPAKPPARKPPARKPPARKPTRQARQPSIPEPSPAPSPQASPSPAASPEPGPARPTRSTRASPPAAVPGDVADSDESMEMFSDDE